MPQRILGYMSNDNSLTPLAFQKVSQEVTLDTSMSSGLGLSFIQQDRVLERKSPQMTGGVHDVFGLLSDAPTRALVACVQDEILAHTREMSPHRFKDWIYAEGMIGSRELRGAEDLNAASLERLPDFLMRNVSEDVPASVRFFDLMYELFQRDIYHVVEHRREEAAKAFAASIARMHHASDAPFHAMLMNQKFMMAAAVGEPLYYRTIKGIEQPAPPPLYEGERTRPVKSPHFRAVIIASLDEAGKEWQTLETGKILFLKNGWALDTVEI